ncbi:MAG: PC4/YdbC family ssDNA-binding protein [Bacillota bacterium]|nr:PC4/YdbC family ssDNA-binding protein [Bacillota bacterium]
MSAIKYDIVKKIGVLSKKETGWQRELNVISWNERPAKYDIRDWAPDGEKMSKGITISDEEMDKLLEFMK